MFASLIMFKIKQVVSQPQCNSILQLLPARPHHHRTSRPCHVAVLAARDTRPLHCADPGSTSQPLHPFRRIRSNYACFITRVACFLTEIRGHPEGYRAAFTPRWDILSEFHPVEAAVNHSFIYDSFLIYIIKTSTYILNNEIMM